MIKSIFDGLDTDEIEIEDQGFYLDGYECEVFYDVYLWNGPRTARTNEVTWEGTTICPIPSIDEDEHLDRKGFAQEIRRHIENALNDEERIGPVYVTC